MRTKGLVMVLIGAACLIGCEKKDPGDALIGTWACVSMTVGPPGYEKPFPCEKDDAIYTIRKVEGVENQYDLTFFHKKKENDLDHTHGTGIYDRDTGTLRVSGGAIVLKINKDGTLSYHSFATSDVPAMDLVFMKVQ